MLNEYADWQQPARERALSTPFATLVLPYRQDTGRVEIALPDFTALSLPDRIFAKLGPKSWRDGPAGTCCAGDSDALRALLHRTTEVQRRLIAEIVAEKAPLRLYLFAAQDLSCVSEYRVRVTSAGAIRRSACLRGPEAPFEAIADFAQTVCVGLRLPLDLDICCLPGGALRLLDINPGLAWRPAAPHPYEVWFFEHPASGARCTAI